MAKMTNSLTNDEAALRDAVLLRARGEFPGLRITLQEGASHAVPHAAREDCLAELALGAFSTDVRLTVKRIHNAGQLAVLRDQRPQADPGIGRLLITDYLTDPMTKVARSLGIQFIDAAGNAYLQIGDNLILSTGNRRAKHSQREFTAPSQAIAPLANTGTAAATKILFAILSRPEIFAALTQREIAAAAGVGVGTVSEVLAALEERAWLRTTSRARGAAERPGRLLEPELLLQEFAINYTVRLRPKLAPMRYTATDPKWNQDLDLTPFCGTWGGEVAAERLLGDYHPGTFVLYLDPERQDLLGRLVAAYRLRPDPNGRVTILQTFWRGSLPDASRGHVPPPLIYAELMTLAEARATECAQRVRQYWMTHDAQQG